MAIVNVPKILRDKLTEEGAEALVRVLDKMEERGQRTVLEIAEGRFERRLTEVKAELKTDIAGFRAELKGDVAGLRTELKGDIAGLRAELKGDIAETKAELIKWMFLFWAGQVAASFAFLKLLK